MTKTQSHRSKHPVSTLATSPKSPGAPQRTRLDEAGQQAFALAKRGAKGGKAFAKEHPLVAAGALAGVALVVGALGERAMHHEPTLGEMVKKTLKGSAVGLSKAIVARTKRGAGAAAKSLSNSLR